MAGVAVVGNDLRVQTHRETIPMADGGALEAVVAEPPDGQARGLVVMVHGDGPVDATYGGLYLPWFEAAADAGLATLSWSKPGVGASTGDWLDQSMADRAAEVRAALDWAADQGLPTENVVLWSASQGGWVAPAVAATDDRIGAVVAVGTAINWLRQGRFHLLAELEDAAAGSAEVAEAVAISDQTRDLLAAGASYETYLAETDDPEPIGEDRWGFVMLNYESDATADLEAMAPRALPVLLLIGTRDRNVDVAETETTYREILGDAVQVKRVDAVHSMARPVMESVSAVGVATALLWPRAVYADGVLESYREFLAGLAP